MHAYRDTLIGPNNIEITLGISGKYSWTVRVESDRLLIEVTSDNRSIAVEKVPNYVMADIARVMALGSVSSLETNKNGN